MKMSLVRAAFPLTALTQTAIVAAIGEPIPVPAGMDNEEKKPSVGLGSTTHKVLTQDTGGGLFVMEQNPPCKTHSSPRPPRQRLRTNPPIASAPAAYTRLHARVRRRR